MADQVLSKKEKNASAFKSYSYSFVSSRPRHEIFQMLLNVRKWWTGFYNETITGQSEKLNDEFSFLAGGGAHYSHQRMVEMVPNESIVWLVMDSKLTFLEKADEWNGTKIRFELSTDEQGCKVSFIHEGLTSEIECYDQCSSAWTGYMEKMKQNLK